MFINKYTMTHTKPVTITIHNKHTHLHIYEALLTKATYTTTTYLFQVCVCF